MAGPLTGTRILDVSSVIMGPYATAILADLGAEVLKLELAEGDVGRRLGPTRTPGLSAIALALHRGKASEVLDPKAPEGRERLRELIQGCDAVVTNLRPSSRERIGLTYEDVRALNPSAVLCTAQAYSSSSPQRDEPAYDDTVQAASGLCDLYRRRDGEPRYAPYVVADKVCGLTIAYALLAALLHRERTGEGQWVDVPMVDTMLAFNLVEQLAGRTFVPPAGSVGWNRTLVPERRPHRALDGWICLMPYSDRNWRDFSEATGHTDLLEDERFASNAARHEHQAELQQALAELAPSRTVAEWLALCRPRGIPVQEVLDLDRIDESAYLRERDLLRSRTHPAEGEYVSIRFPVDFSRTPIDDGGHAPQLGEHTGRGWTTSATDAIVRRLATLDAYRPPHHGGTTNRRILGPEHDGVGDVSFVRGTLEPGGGADPHFHERSDQLIFVIGGACRVRAGAIDAELGPDDTIFLPRALPHEVEVRGDVPLELLIVYRPALRPDDVHPVERA